MPARLRGCSKEATMEEGTREVAAVRAALAAGRLAVPDPETGFHHAIYAVCPHDGTHAPVRRVVRGARGAITQVMARCPRCGDEMAPAPEELHLH
jgi:nitrite reductase/ring-hydroxylating ferredoxin subunit